MIRRTLASLPIAALIAAAPAVGAVITFDAYNVGSSTTATRGADGAIFEDGFRIGTGVCDAPSPNFPTGRCFISAQRLAGDAIRRSIDRSTTSAAMLTVFQGQNITIDAVDGGAFTFGGVDIKSSYSSNPTSVDFIYTLLGGGTGRTRFDLPTSTVDPDGSTYTLDGVGAITRLVLDPVQANGHFQFDNIQVTAVAAAVPEPASWAMMLAGFGAAGAVLRRRRSAVVAPAMAG